MTAMRPHENAHHTGRKLLQEMRRGDGDLLSGVCSPWRQRARAPHHHPPGRIINIRAVWIAFARKRQAESFCRWPDHGATFYTPGVLMQQCLHIIKSATVGDTTICLLPSILVVNKIGLAANFSYQRSVDTAHRARIFRRFFYRKIKEGKK